MRGIPLRNRVAVLVITTASVLLTATTPSFAQLPAAQPAVERTAVLAEWESLKYGMFIDFGLSTLVQDEYGKKEDASCADYRPTRLDTEQWARVAKEAGMKYAALTTKHCDGHCLWPSKLSDRTVAQSPVKDDVVKLFVDVCRKQEIKPGLDFLLNNFAMERMVWFVTTGTALAVSAYFGFRFYALREKRREDVVRMISQISVESQKRVPSRQQ